MKQGAAALGHPWPSRHSCVLHSRSTPRRCDSRAAVHGCTACGAEDAI